MSTGKLPDHALLFNAIVDVSLRVLIVLSELSPPARDLEELVVLDYFLVHSEDVNGPESLHPAVPHRSGEMLVRRGIIRRALAMLERRQLVERHLGADGITFGPRSCSDAYFRWI